MTRALTALANPVVMNTVGVALDNETGLVKLQFQLHVGAARADVELSRISFQVITLAAL